MESYSVASDEKNDKALCQIGGMKVDLEAAGKIRDGGDTILHRIPELSSSESSSTNALPDHTAIFYALHPHAYNLRRTLRSSRGDVHHEAYTQFKELRNSVLQGKTQLSDK